VLAHLYVSELLEAMRNAIATPRRRIAIWGDYFVQFSGATIAIVTSRGEPMGHMMVSELDGTVYFSKLLTSAGYERQGIGTLVVLMGILFAHIKGAGSLSLGETDTDAVKGGHFWRTLSLFDGVRTPGAAVLRALLDAQARLAQRLNASLDPNAVLVALHPVCRGGGGGGKSEKKKKKRLSL
jgi:hypothetical protein